MFSTLGLADGIPDYDWGAKEGANEDIFMHGKGGDYRPCLGDYEEHNARNHRLPNASYRWELIRAYPQGWRNVLRELRQH